jgi:hypothetical protein
VKERIHAMTMPLGARQWQLVPEREATGTHRHRHE